ncbi:MAG: hypothetical protein ABR878_18970 [Roseiarcus sp.]
MRQFTVFGPEPNRVLPSVGLKQRFDYRSQIDLLGLGEVHRGEFGSLRFEQGFEDVWPELRSSVPSEKVENGFDRRNIGCVESFRVKLRALLIPDCGERSLIQNESIRPARAQIIPDSLVAIAPPI